MTYRAFSRINRLTNSRGFASLEDEREQLFRMQREAIRLNSKKSLQNGLMYTLTFAIGIFAVGYASVPLYRMFCQKTGYAGTISSNVDRFDKKNMIPIDNSDRIKINFDGDASPSLQWTLKPQQRFVKVKPGETALAFFTASNNSPSDVTGIATYSVTPPQVAQYFSKIACFCFEEQRLSAGESVDMPVFFFIDPEFVKDPNMKDIKNITLSYTFFKAKSNAHENLI